MGTIPHEAHPGAAFLASGDVAPVPRTLLLHARIFGIPVPQGRPRSAIITRRMGRPRIHVYDPPTSAMWKKTVLLQLLRHRPPVPVEGPIAVSLDFFLPRPKSLPRRVMYHLTRPDEENLGKAIKDSMTGVIYRDDSQIVDSRVTKQYGDPPGVVIRVERLV